MSFLKTIQLFVANKPSWNEAVPPILKEYHEKVKPMGVSLVMFNSVIGRLNGRYGVES